MSNISILNTLASANSTPPVINTINFTYYLNDIESQNIPPYIYAQSTLYDSDNIITRTPMGFITGIFNSQLLNNGKYITSLISWNFVINSLQNPSDNLDQPNVLTGSGFKYTSDVPDLFPYPSKSNGSLKFNGINCGYYELDIDDVGTRFFRLSLTQNIN
jgi:hypothetical protein